MLPNNGPPQNIIVSYFKENLVLVVNVASMGKWSGKWTRAIPSEHQSHMSLWLTLPNYSRRLHHDKVVTELADNRLKGSLI